ncbi:MAG: hypothetical protein VX738_07630 [Planctomycetota bacterium]|nr:hypothetical protein [Planctomycetota bacterium]
MEKEKIVFCMGICHFLILIASAMVPMKLNWKEDLAVLSKLHRQMYWVYGGYVVLSIVAFGLICVFNAAEIALGSPLARALCAYIAVFWGIRFALQWVFDAKPFLTRWWLRAGYHGLSVLFVAFTLIFGGLALGY